MLSRAPESRDPAEFPSQTMPPQLNAQNLSGGAFSSSLEKSKAYSNAGTLKKGSFHPN